MEELQVKPTPLPRSSPVGHNQPSHIAKQLKRPVPLPRSSTPAVSLSTSENVLQDKTVSESSTFEEVLSKGVNTLTKSIRNKIKIASENVRESTKTVARRTSVKGILPKRQSAIIKTDNDLAEPTKVERCQSLPSENIFSSIKFGSPIRQNFFDSTSDLSNDGLSLPPPEYPPPPLPDESFYDQLSTKSSHSGSHGEFHTCPSQMSSILDINSVGSYEDLSSSYNGSDINLSRQSYLLETPQQNVSSPSKPKFPTSRNMLPATENKAVEVSSSNSWHYYDTVDIKSRKSSSSQYENYVIPSNEFNFSNNNIYSNEKSPEGGTENNVIPNQSTKDYQTQKPLYPLKVENEVNEEVTRNNVALGRQVSVISNASSMSVPNELYCNWEPPGRQNDDTKPNFRFPTKSIFYEFDPLYEGYGKIAKKAESLPGMNDQLPNNLIDDFDTVSLPIPPPRVDSISTDLASQPDIPNDIEYSLYHRPIARFSEDGDQLDSNSRESPAFETASSSNADSSPSNSPERDLGPGKKKSNIVRWSSMKRVIKKVTDTSNWSPGAMRKLEKSKDDDSLSLSPKEECSDKPIERPPINPSSGPLHSGFIFRSPSGGEKPRDYVQKWCQLAEGRLTFCSEKNSMNKEILHMEHIYSLQIIRETKQSVDGEAVYCMEISCSPRDKPINVGSPGTTERRIWMQRLLESLTLVFPSRLSAEYTRAGWCFFKERITGSWVASWLLLHKRTLYVKQSTNMKLSEIDLRKAINIVLQDNEEGCTRVGVRGPTLRIDCHDCVYYLQMNEPRETKAWSRVLREAAVENGLRLEDQQLNKDDLPTIIDRCIKFVDAYGSMSEGIYRRSGSNTSVSKLLRAFQKDAFAVYITPADYTEHDVASVLKRFFRELPEPLLTTSLHKLLCNVATLDCSEEEKVLMYRSQLEKLPPVNYVTTRSLMAHLNRIHEQRERNFMPIENLASIWGPTLMHIESQQPGMDANWSRNESVVVQDLISLYQKLFHVDDEERARENKIQKVLSSFYGEQIPHPTKPSGDMMIWIHIGTRDSEGVSVKVGPHREAQDVCKELCDRLRANCYDLCLLESVLGGVLMRPLHHTEKILDAVLRWCYWDDTDSKDNCLILIHNTVLKDIAPYAKPPVAQCGELRFADLKSKSFKTYQFEFSQAKLCYYKDKSGSTKLGEWKIEDIIWYIGHEPKRNPNTRWSITFIPKCGRSKRSKECPFFGFTIAGTTQEEQFRWMAAMLVGEYPHIDILPRPQHNLLE